MNLGAVTAPFVYSESLQVLVGRKKEKVTRAVSITTYGGVFHVRFSNMNCTIAAKVDDFDALHGLSDKYDDDKGAPETVIGTSMNLHVCVSKYLVLQSWWCIGWLNDQRRLVGGPVDDDEDGHSIGSFNEIGGAGGDSKGVQLSLVDLMEQAKDLPDGSSSSNDDEEEPVLEVVSAKKSNKRKVVSAKAPILSPRVTGARTTTKGDRPFGPANPLRGTEPPAKKRRLTSSGNSQSSQSSHSSQSPAQPKKRSRKRTTAAPTSGHMFVFLV